MSAEDILKIIQAIPEYIIYIYPGYLTVYLYLFLRGKTLKDNNYILVKAMAISYIHLAVIDWLRGALNLCFLKIPDAIKTNAALIIIASLSAYVAYKITLSKRIKKLFDFLDISTTFYENEIEVLADFNSGAWLCVYLKDDNVVYEGSLGYKELDEDKRRYICLNSYYKYYLNKRGKPKEPYIEDHDNEPDETVLIFYDSIKRIEKRNCSSNNEAPE